MTLDQALAALKEGNDKFVTDAPYRQATDCARRLEIARGQTLFTVLVSSSDSRVPPELLFGRGFGGNSSSCAMQATRLMDGSTKCVSVP
jgi:carbonic anhydrase